MKDLEARRTSWNKILDYLFGEGGAAVVIALVLIGILAYTVVTNQQVDEKLWNLFLIVIGFYFGANTGRRDKV